MGRDGKVLLHQVKQCWISLLVVIFPAIKKGLGSRQEWKGNELSTLFLYRVAAVSPDGT